MDEPRRTSKEDRLRSEIEGIAIERLDLESEYAEEHDKLRRRQAELEVELCRELKRVASRRRIARVGSFPIRGLRFFVRGEFRVLVELVQADLERDFASSEAGRARVPMHFLRSLAEAAVLVGHQLGYLLRRACQRGGGTSTVG